MPVAFDICSPSQRPVFFREIDMSDSPSPAGTGSDSSVSKTAALGSIKIRILPRRIIGHSVVPDWGSGDDNPRACRIDGGVGARPATKRNEPALQREDLNRRQPPTSVTMSTGQLPADAVRKRRHVIGSKRFAFDCLSAKHGSVKYNDVTSTATELSAAQLGDDDVTFVLGQFTTTKVDCVSDSSDKCNFLRDNIYNIRESGEQLESTCSPDEFSGQSIVKGNELLANFRSAPAALRRVERKYDKERLGEAAILSSSSRSRLTDFRYPCGFAMIHPGFTSTASRSAADVRRPGFAPRPVLRASNGAERPRTQQHHQNAQQPSLKARATSGLVDRRVGDAGGDGLARIGRELTSYEATELTGYRRIYYIGKPTCDRKLTMTKTGKKETLLNDRTPYDNSEGLYNVIPQDHFAYRYEINRLLGCGSFGQVVRAFDHKERRWVALKIIRNENRFRQQANDEVRMLQMINEANADGRYNAVRMLEFFDFRQHFCIVFEPLGIDLYEVLRRRNFVGFPLGAARRVTKGIVTCLQLLGQLGMIHCDLKPENVLLNLPTSLGPQHITVKVIDFGSSCLSEDRPFLYVQSRFYRAPEIILGAKYGPAIDMWSLGCMVAELVTGRPLFAGHDEFDQLKSQMEYLGLPPDQLLLRSSRASKFFCIRPVAKRRNSQTAESDECTDDEQYDVRPYVNPSDRSGTRRGRPGSKEIRETLLDINGREPEHTTPRHEDYVDFVGRCLEWDPDYRMTPDEALRHVWMESIKENSSVGLEPSTTEKKHRSAVQLRQASTESFNTFI